MEVNCSGQPTYIYRNAEEALYLYKGAKIAFSIS
jgi:hypothetical protein